jgi:ribonuclease E
MALLILRELEEEGIRKRSREVLVTAPVPIANYLLNEKREHITILEARYGMAVRIESDPHMISPDHKMEKFKSSTRRVSRAAAQTAITIDSVEPFTVEEDLEELQPKAENTEDQPKKKRRRRRRRGKDRNENQVLDPQDTELTEIETPPAQEPDVPPQSEFDTTTEEKSKRSRTTRRQSAKKKDDENLATSEKPEVEEKTKKPARRPITRKKVESAKTKDSEETEAPTDKIKSKEKPKRKPRTKKSKAELAGGPTVASVDPKPVSEPTPKPVSNPTPELATAKMESKPAQEPETPTAKPKPKRSGWWSRAKLKD